MTALDEALGRGQGALDSLPLMLEEARDLRARAGACENVLRRVRDSAASAGHLLSPGQNGLRREFLRDVGGLRRGLRRRIVWLSWRLFWRRMRLWVMLILLLAAIAFAAGWAVKNRDWLAERMATMQRGPAPVQDAGPPDGAGTAPDPGHGNQAGGAP